MISAGTDVARLPDEEDGSSAACEDADLPRSRDCEVVPGSNRTSVESTASFGPFENHVFRFESVPVSPGNATVSALVTFSDSGAGDDEGAVGNSSVEWDLTCPWDDEASDSAPLLETLSLNALRVASA